MDYNDQALEDSAQTIDVAAAEQTHPAYGNGQVSSAGGNMTVTHGTSPLTPEINMLVTAERTIFQVCGGSAATVGGSLGCLPRALSHPPAVASDAAAAVAAAPAPAAPQAAPLPPIAVVPPYAHVPIHQAKFQSQHPQQGPAAVVAPAQAHAGPSALAAVWHGHCCWHQHPVLQPAHQAHIPQPHLL